jgi:hypothetical protein
MMTRRHFMGAITAVAVAGGMGMGSAFVTRRNVSLAKIVPTTALPLQGMAVTLRSDDGPSIRGVIKNVTAVKRPGRSGTPGTEQISLLVSPDNPEALGGNYSVETDDLKLGQLTFMPVGRTGRQRRLEAVINRIV